MTPSPNQTPTTLYLAGIDDSGPGHWQRHWYEAETGPAHWVGHASWSAPDLAAWGPDLDAALAAVPGPVRVVAHSLGCTLLASWARTAAPAELARIRDAFLVAAPDPTGPHFPTTATGFPTDAYARPLPFPTLLVTSSDDPYADLAHAARAARGLGAELREVGPLGHVNAASALGDWPTGRALRAELDPR
ncbi:RBBP9/YdeN family alpha/beta hydrolase [Streptomyces sp. BI20]|uniref:RBBP9/YdeN family alpha/beta hydrolase n=1 Tax=Streptomyces sp. BI20 TaxID=3403460 RepID=UPI003C75BAE0